MEVPLLQTHCDQALALWAQRALWRDMPMLPAQALLGLERRLQLHLHVLARVPAEASALEGVEAGRLLSLAAGLLSPEAERRRASAVQALDWLAGEDPDRVRTAFRALSLFSAEEARALLHEAWHENTGLHPLLTDIYRIQGLPLPDDAPTTGSEDAVVVRLRHAADTGLAPVEALRPFYRTEMPAIRAAALRAGMLHGDPEAAAELLRSLAREMSGAESTDLLRLAALAGLPEAGPLLREHAAQDPATGYALLALWGHVEAVGKLLEGLDTARDNALAAGAWQMLTGQRLAQRPRMQLVGTAEGGQPEAEPEERIHDAEAAHAWWSSRQPQWPAGQRMLLGQPLALPVALEALQLDAGAGAHDGLDRIALLLGRPLGVAGENWILNRQRALGVYAGPASQARQTARPTAMEG